MLSKFEASFRGDGSGRKCSTKTAVKSILCTLSAMIQNFCLLYTSFIYIYGTGVVAVESCLNKVRRYREVQALSRATLE